MSYTFTRLQEMVVIDCCNCGMPFAVTADFNRRRHETGASFFCPNGHSQVYRETEIQKLQNQIAVKERLLANIRDDLRVEAASHVATKRKLTRTINRAHAGLCLKCNRHFVALERHMATKHSQDEPKGSSA